MAIKRAQSTAKQEIEATKKAALDVGQNEQDRLAEILANSPHLVSLNGTPWEVRALKYGTQYQIAAKVCELNAIEDATYGDGLKSFKNGLEGYMQILALALLNDKDKIFKDGKESNGYSKQFTDFVDWLMWNIDNATIVSVISEVMALLDVSFFTEVLGMLQIFRTSVTEKKRTRKTTTIAQSKSMLSAR